MVVPAVDASSNTNNVITAPAKAGTPLKVIMALQVKHLSADIVSLAVAKHGLLDGLDL